LPTASTSHSTATHVIEHQLGALIRRAIDVRLQATGAGGKRLERAGYAILLRLADAPALRIGELAERLGLDFSTVSRQVASLARAGLVTRTPDPQDGRAALLDLSEAGRRALRSTRRARRERLRTLLAGWEEHEVVAFARLLERFNADAEAVAR
jgi:DNA-binding MarR family transcriptional regulator